MAPVTDDDRDRRLAQLDARIRAVRQSRAPEPKHPDMHSQGQLAWRMVTELVAGLGIGVAIGYGLDSFFETLPVFLVTFTLLGLAAGVKTMLRSAEEVQRQTAAAADAAARADDAAGRPDSDRSARDRPDSGRG